MKKMFDWMPGLGRGRDGALNAVAAENPMAGILGKDPDLDGTEIVQRRHIEFLEHQIFWRRALDAYEGGDRYRNAVYGPDRKGLPCRNLFRHAREYPNPQEWPLVQAGFAGGLANITGELPNVGFGPYPGMLGADPAATAADDEYELRRARTPVPGFVAHVVGVHLSKLYDQEVTRGGPPELVKWWKNVDGRGTTIDDWMVDTLAPLVLVLGCLDVCFDHPRVPPGQRVVTRHDELQLGLDKVIASYILPQNMLWWQLDQAGRYTRCLVREYQDPSSRIDCKADGTVIDLDNEEEGASWKANYERYRYWTDTESILFAFDGNKILQRMPHSFGRVPIVRLLDRKKHRTPHIGKSRYDAVIELAREFYNKDSELTLADTLQAHALLSGPEDFCKADNTLSIGPGFVLPKKKNPETGAYEGWEYTAPPAGPADSIRTNKGDLIALIEMEGCLQKAAGAAGTVGQSGVSKEIDARTGHRILRDIARRMAANERTIAEYALLALRHVVPDEVVLDTVKITYPARFELQTADDLLGGLGKLQQSFLLAGEEPVVESAIYKSLIRQLLLGLSDEQYAELDRRIDMMLQAKAKEKGHDTEMPQIVPGISDASNTFEGEGSAEEAAGEDPTGQSAGTMVSNMIPAVQ